MPLFSALFATLLALYIGDHVANQREIWDQLSRVDRFWAIFACVYAVTGATAGWAYVRTNHRIAGWTHSSLMLGAAGILGFYGLSVLLDWGFVRKRDIPPSSGVGMVDLMAFVCIVVGLIACTFGVGVITHVLKGTRTQVIQSENIGRQF